MSLTNQNIHDIVKKCQYIKDDPMGNYYHTPLQYLFYVDSDPTHTCRDAHSKLKSNTRMQLKDSLYYSPATGQHKYEYYRRYELFNGDDTSPNYTILLIIIFAFIVFYYINDCQRT